MFSKWYPFMGFPVWGARHDGSVVTRNVPQERRQYGMASSKDWKDAGFVRDSLYNRQHNPKLL
jgi:hypothetical protein